MPPFRFEQERLNVLYDDEDDQDTLEDTLDAVLKKGDDREILKERHLR